MEYKDTKFNQRISYLIFGGIIVLLIIGFLYNASQSATEIDYLKQEKSILVNDLTLMKAEVDRLSALDELNELELQDSKFKVQQLLDSVGRLNFTVAKLRAFKYELKVLEARHDSLIAKTGFLQDNNELLAQKYGDTKSKIAELKERSSSLTEAEALLREKNIALNKELKIKNYLNLSHSLGTAHRVRDNGKPIKTSKAEAVEKIRGCFAIKTNPTVKEVQEKVVYLQILNPNMQIIADAQNTVSVNGNTYSKRVSFMYDGSEMEVCDFITVSKGSLETGIYTLNIFEDERLLSSHEFTLK